MLSLFGAFFCMTGKPQISPQKWERMRRHYLTASITLKELSELHGVGYSTVRRYASTNNWFAHRQSQRLLVESEARNNLSERLLAQASALQQTADYCSIPMSKEKHYDMLIRLLQLQAKLRLKNLEQTVPLEQESPQPCNVIPLRQTHRPSTRLKRSHS
jgi:hypothetical protein